jgi:hypothetical protein
VGQIIYHLILGVLDACRQAPYKFKDSYGAAVCGDSTKVSTIRTGEPTIFTFISATCTCKCFLIAPLVPKVQYICRSVLDSTNVIYYLAVLYPMPVELLMYNNNTVYDNLVFSMARPCRIASHAHAWHASNASNPSTEVDAKFSTSTVNLRGKKLGTLPRLRLGRIIENQSLKYKAKLG